MELAEIHSEKSTLSSLFPSSFAFIYIFGKDWHIPFF